MTENRDKDTHTWFDAVLETGLELPGSWVLEEIGAELQAGLDGATPDPGDIEAALGDVTVPGIGALDVEAAVRVGDTVGDERADAIVEAGGQAVDIAIEGSGEAATVLVDTGGEVLEVAAESGGEAAAEATAEVLAEALDGL